MDSRLILITVFAALSFGTAYAAPTVEIHCGKPRGGPCLKKGDAAFSSFIAKNACVKRLSAALRSYSPDSFPNIKASCGSGETPKLALTFYFPEEPQALSAEKSPKFYVLEMDCIEKGKSGTEKIRPVFSHANPMESPYRKIAPQDRVDFCIDPRSLIEGMKEDERRLDDLKTKRVRSITTAPPDRHVSDKVSLKPDAPQRFITPAIPDKTSATSRAAK